MNNETHEIELQIEEARKFVELENAVQRLMKNKDFQTVIQEEYFKNEPVRLTQALSAPSLSDTEYQDAIIKSLSGIGQLQQFFNKVRIQADMAEKSIEESNEALNEISEEEESGGLH